MRYKKPIDFNTEDLEVLKISELKRIADYWLRQYLLKKAKRRNNLIYCPLKEKWYPEHKIQVAHFIDRAMMSCRYDLNNCNLISEQSNSWDAQIPKEGYKSKHHYDYEMWLGQKKVEKLLQKSKQLIIFAREDYISIINKFRNE